MSTKPLGKTGQFPSGMLNKDDEGALRLAVSTENGTVRIDFGSEVTWIAMPPDIAVKLAMAILKAAGVKGQ
jgi:hypothetical protein